MGIRVERLSTEAEVGASIPDWRRIHAVSESSTPFNHPSWILSWWQARRTLGLTWVCYVGRDRDGNLVGILPLARYPDGAIRFAGHDLHDVAASLIDNDLGRVEAWRRAIETMSQFGTTLELPTLDDHDLSALQTLNLGSRLRQYDVDPGCRIELPCTWDEYWNSLSVKRRKQMRAERRALEQVHGAVRLTIAESGEALARAAEEFWALRERAWRVRGRYEELATHVRGPAMRSFLAQLAANSSGTGLTMVGHLRAGDWTIGSALLLQSGGRIWYAMCAFEPRFAKYGPGRLLLAECVRLAIANGDTHFELGRGAERYKVALGATRYELPNIRLQLNPWGDSAS